MNKSCNNCLYYNETCSGAYGISEFVCGDWREKVVRVMSPCVNCTHAIHREIKEKESEATHEWYDCELTSEGGLCEYQNKQEAENGKLPDVQ